MTLEEAIAYLRMWARLNVQSVYGSDAIFIDIDRLNAELNRIEDAK